MYLNAHDFVLTNRHVLLFLSLESVAIVTMFCYSPQDLDFHTSYDPTLQY